MPTCECGHRHCCHKNTKTELTVDPEDQHEFNRITCADCHAWIRDENIQRIPLTKELVEA